MDATTGRDEKPKPDAERAGVESAFVHYVPTAAALKAQERLWAEARRLALAVVDIVPAGPERDTAVAQLLGAAVVANHGIARLVK